MKPNITDLSMQVILKQKVWFKNTVREIDDDP